MASPRARLSLVELAEAEDRLADYIRQAWPIIEPNTRYISNWHIDLIGEHLEAVTDGQLTRVIFNLPPRHMKSITISVMWPTRSGPSISTCLPLEGLHRSKTASGQPGPTGPPLMLA